MKRNSISSSITKKESDIGLQNELDNEVHSDDKSEQEDSNFPALRRPDDQGDPMIETGEEITVDAIPRWLGGPFESCSPQESNATDSLGDTQVDALRAMQHQDEYTQLPIHNVLPPTSSFSPVMVNPYAARFLQPSMASTDLPSRNIQQVVIQQVASNLLASMMTSTGAAAASSSSTSVKSSPIMPGFSLSSYGWQQISSDSEQQQRQSKQKERISAAATSNACTTSQPSIGLTNRSAVPLYLDFDEQTLNEYQCLVRKQIELFETKEEDIKSNAQGRNVPILIGQVGIRCR
jgi:hypothetical protein